MLCKALRSPDGDKPLANRAQEGKVHQIIRSEQRSMIECSLFLIVVANWRFDNAKSPAALLQGKSARTPHAYASRCPLATLAHEEEEWNGTDGPNNWVQTVDLQMPRAPCSTQENNPNTACRTHVHTQVGHALILFSRYAVCTWHVSTKKKARCGTAAAPQKQ